MWKENKKMYQRVNLKYVKAKRKENKEKKLIMKELYKLINDYCIEVTGKVKEHILFDEVKGMFPNNEIIDYTITYAYNCMEGLSDVERDYLYKIIHTLVDLKEVYKNQIPF